MRLRKVNSVKVFKPKIVAPAKVDFGVNGAEEKAYCAKFLKLADTALQMPPREQPLKKAS